MEDATLRMYGAFGGDIVGRMGFGDYEKDAMAPVFPPSITTDSFGLLILEENFITADCTARHYSPEGKEFPVAGIGPVRLIAWPQDSGVPDPSALASFVERRWSAIIENLDQLRTLATPAVTKVIGQYCPPDDDYPPPTAQELFREAKLTAIKIDLDGDHEVQFFCSEIRGGLDLSVVLDARLHPVSAYFDG